jgi:hypothetical protein
LKNAFRESRLAGDDSLNHSAREELWRFSKEFYATGTQSHAKVGKLR